MCSDRVKYFPSLLFVFFLIMTAFIEAGESKELFKKTLEDPLIQTITRGLKDCLSLSEQQLLIYVISGDMSQSAAGIESFLKGNSVKVGNLGLGLSAINKIHIFHGFDSGHHEASQWSEVFYNEIIITDVLDNEEGCKVRVKHEWVDPDVYIRANLVKCMSSEFLSPVASLIDIESFNLAFGYEGANIPASIDRSIHPLISAIERFNSEQKRQGYCKYSATYCEHFDEWYPKIKKFVSHWLELKKVYDFTLYSGFFDENTILKEYFSSFNSTQLQTIAYLCGVEQCVPCEPILNSDALIYSLEAGAVSVGRLFFSLYATISYQTLLPEIACLHPKFEIVSNALFEDLIFGSSQTLHVKAIRINGVEEYLVHPRIQTYMMLRNSADFYRKFSIGGGVYASCEATLLQCVRALDDNINRVIRSPQAVVKFLENSGKTYKRPAFIARPRVLFLKSADQRLFLKISRKLWLEQSGVNYPQVQHLDSRCCDKNTCVVYVDQETHKGWCPRCAQLGDFSLAFEPLLECLQESFAKNNVEGAHDHPLRAGFAHEFIAQFWKLPSGNRTSVKPRFFCHKCSTGIYVAETADKNDKNKYMFGCDTCVLHSPYYLCKSCQYMHCKEKHADINQPMTAGQLMEYFPDYLMGFVCDECGDRIASSACAKEEKHIPAVTGLNKLLIHCPHCNLDLCGSCFMLSEQEGQ